MPPLRHFPLFFLILFGLASSQLSGQEQGTSLPEPPQPTAQEQLLAELLAKLPEADRAALMARALATARVGSAGSPLDSSASAARPQGVGNQELETLRSDQRQLQAELARLRREALGLAIRIDRMWTEAPRELVQTPLLPTPVWARQTFLLPTFQQPGLETSRVPRVNQPSGPLPAWSSPPLENPAAAIELAQLRRDLQRLNQRLQQWQDRGPGPLAPRETDSSAGNSTAPAPQAARPSPLLPR